MSKIYSVLKKLAGAGVMASLPLLLLFGPKNAWKGIESSSFIFFPGTTTSEKAREFITKDAIVKVSRLSSSPFVDRGLQFYGLLYDVYFPNKQEKVKVYDSGWVSLPVYGLFQGVVGTALASKWPTRGESGANGVFDGLDEVYFEDKDKRHVLKISLDRILADGKGWFHFNGVFGCVNKKHQEYIWLHQEEYFAKATNLFYLCVSLDKKHSDDLEDKLEDNK